MPVSARVILAAFCCCIVAAAQHRVETIAGGIVRSGVPARDVEVRLGSGISTTPNGAILVADRTNTIRMFAPGGNIDTLAGTGWRGYTPDGAAATSADLDDPEFPIYDARARVYYFAERSAHRIRAVDTGSNRITTVVGNGIRARSDMNLEGRGPSVPVGDVSDMALAPSGSLYFADDAAQAIETGRVRRLDRDGTVHTVAGVTGTRLAVDGAGNLYVFDEPGVARLAPDGTVTRFAGTSQYPAGKTSLQEGAAAGQYLGTVVSMAGAPDGGMYASVAADQYSSTTAIIRIDAAGNLRFVAGGQGVSGQLAVLPDGRLIVGHRHASGTRDVIDVFQPDGTATTVAAATPQRAPDGTLAREAWLLGPTSIAVNSKGEIHVAERVACDVRKIGLDGRLSTVSGTGACTPAGSPEQILVDREDRVWVSAESGLYRIEPDGTPYYLALPSVPPISTTAFVKAIDANDRLYALDGGNLVRIETAGTTQPLAAGMSMGGIGSDLAGNVYFVGESPGPEGPALYRINNDGSYTRLFAVDPVIGGYFGSRTGAKRFVVDSTGRVLSALLYVADATGTRPVAGGTRSSRDGALAATFLEGTDIALAPNGEAVVLDGDRIRRVVGTDPTARPSFTAAGAVNALSYVAGPITSGEIIAIFGSNFGAGGLLVNAPVNNRIPYVAGNTRVFINGVNAPILALTPTQINAIVPMGITSTHTGSPQTQMVVGVDTVASDPITVPVAAHLLGNQPFGLASADASGSGQGAILNEDQSLNSPSNPAPPGSVVALFGTGAGFMTGVLDYFGPNANPQVPDGSLVLFTPLPKPLWNAKATVGGKDAEVVYWGAAPTLVLGAIQANVRIPADLAAGVYNVTVNVGGLDSPPATVAVK